LNRSSGRLGCDPAISRVGTIFRNWIKDVRGRPFLVDALLSMVLATGVLAIAISATPADALGTLKKPDHPLEWLLTLIPAATVAFRRKAPIPGTVVAMLATLAIWAMDFPSFFLAAATMLYSVVVYGPKPAGLRTAVSSSVALTGLASWGYLAGEAPLFVVPLTALAAATATALGMSVATRAEYTAEVEQRARLAEQNQQQREEALLNAERSRIARELHDVVAHGLGVIVVQAGAGRRVVNVDPAAALKTLSTIEELGRTSLTEMRHTLGLLRTEDDEKLRPTPGVASLKELVADYKASGLPVVLNEVGTQPKLPSTVDTSIYRIVQEALTNTLKHGGPDVEAFTEIVYQEQAIEVRILDNGRGGSAPPGGGHGLLGMRERVDVFGGTLRTGPRPGGGFEVVAALPLNPASLS